MLGEVQKILEKQATNDYLSQELSLKIQDVISGTPDISRTDLTKLIKDTITCPITLETIISPVITPCGHTFEQKELAKCTTNKCPSCRQTIEKGSIKPNETLNRIIFEVIYKSSLHEAIFSRKGEIVASLINKGADFLSEVIDPSDPQKMPLSGLIHMVRYDNMQDALSELPIYDRAVTPQYKDPYAHALLIAAQLNKTDYLRILLEKGAIPTTLFQIEGKSDIHFAVIHNQLEQIKLLLSYAKKISLDHYKLILNKKWKNHPTPLNLACDDSVSLEVFNFLVSQPNLDIANILSLIPKSNGHKKNILIFAYLLRQFIETKNINPNLLELIDQTILNFENPLKELEELEWPQEAVDFINEAIRHYVTKQKYLITAPDFAEDQRENKVSKLNNLFLSIAQLQLKKEDKYLWQGELRSETLKAFMIYMSENIPKLSTVKAWGLAQPIFIAPRNKSLLAKILSINKETSSATKIRKENFALIPVPTTRILPSHR